MVDREGMGGGLALFWNSNVNVNIKSYSSHHIDAVVQNESGKLWRCTGIYGHPEANRKHHTWTLLKRLANIFSYPWCCFGDFNEVLHLNEKSGGNERNLNMVAEFRETIQTCNFVDIGCKGCQFTWSNRFFCSKDWSNNFQEPTAINLVNWTSNHCPIIFEVKERCKRVEYTRRSYPRDHYEDMWSACEACKNIVRDEWANYIDRH